MSERVKALIFILIGAACALGLPPLYNYYLKPYYKKYTASWHDHSSTLPSQPESEVTPTAQTAIPYNFERLVKIIDESYAIKRSFYKRFHKHETFKKDAYQHIINLKQTKTTLEELYREKERLKQYAWHMKVRFKGEVPTKKMRTILYYQRVIDTCITDLEAIIRKL